MARFASTMILLRCSRIATYKTTIGPQGQSNMLKRTLSAAAAARPIGLEFWAHNCLIHWPGVRLDGASPPDTRRCGIGSNCRNTSLV